MKKSFTVSIVVIWVAFGIYMLLPAPTIRDLPNALKSDEPGDTYQNPGVTGFYNDMTRSQVVNYYQQQFCCSSLFGIPLPTYKLNHSPELAKTLIKDEIRVWYFEELVHPFRESYYVAGWTPALAQLARGWRHDPVLKGTRIYFQKTNVKMVGSSEITRLFVFLFTSLAFVLGYRMIGQIKRKDLWQTI